MGIHTENERTKLGLRVVCARTLAVRMRPAASAGEKRGWSGAGGSTSSRRAQRSLQLATSRLPRALSASALMCPAAPTCARTHACIRIC